jgi:hypothetical protein
MRLTPKFRGTNGVRLSKVILGRIVSRHAPATSISAIARIKLMRHALEVLCPINRIDEQADIIPNSEKKEVAVLI